MRGEQQKTERPNTGIVYVKNERGGNKNDGRKDTAEEGKGNNR